MATPARPWSDRKAALAVQQVSRWQADRYPLAIASALICGATVRFSYIHSADFPLNDGGLFFVMVRDLQAAGYSLPETTSYNAASLPFAYPPLGFYIAGITEDLTGIPLLTLFRLLPFLWSIVALFAFWRLSCAALPGGRTRTAALFAFALLPNVYEWPLMGGGVTRGLGLACALLTLGECWRLFAGGPRWHILTGAAAAAAAILSHPNAAWFVAYSALLLALTVGHSRRALAGAAVIGIGSAILTAPWWLLTLMHHGRAAIPSSLSANVPLYGGALRLVLLTLTKEPFLAVICGLALLGLLTSIGRRRFLLPTWLLFASVLEPRAIDYVGAVTALLAGVGVVDVLVPLLTGHWTGLPGEDSAAPPRPFRSRAMPRLGLVLLIYVALGPVIFGSESLRALSPDERVAIEWVSIGTSADAHILVLSAARTWEEDRVSEWLPALTGRRSVATPQGYEWGGDFVKRTAAHRDAQSCIVKQPACLEEWSAEAGETFEYVYVAKALPTARDTSHSWGVTDATLPFRALLDSDARWLRVYDGPAATIYHRSDLRARHMMPVSTSPN